MAVFYSSWIESVLFFKNGFFQMPAPKIATFKGEKYLECLWTGLKLESAYAYPDFDRNGHRLKGGSFSDAACCLAWVEEQHRNKKINDKKREGILSEIARDLDLYGDQRLVCAPDRPKPFGDFDYSYRTKYPWLFQSQKHVTLPEVLEWKEAAAKQPKKRKLKLWEEDGTEMEGLPRELDYDSEDDLFYDGGIRKFYIAFKSKHAEPKKPRRRGAREEYEWQPYLEVAE
jgi:hypothetical protein